MSTSDQLAFDRAKLAIVATAHAHGLVDAAAVAKQRSRVPPGIEPPTSLELTDLAALTANPATAPLTTSAWLPFVALTVRLAVRALNSARSAAIDAVWAQLDAISLSDLLQNATGLLTSSATDAFAADCAALVAFCAANCDRRGVLTALNVHVSELLLAGLVVGREVCCDTLRTQLVQYNVWSHAQALKPSDAASSIVLRLVDRLVVLTRVQPLVASEPLVALVAMLVDVTAQAPTGKFLSWYIAHRSCKSAACEPLGWLVWLQRTLAPLNSRLLLALAARLECNVMTFLFRPRSADTYEPFAAHQSAAACTRRRQSLELLLGIATALPDAEYMADLVAGRLHVPKLSVHFLGIDDYLARHFALYKAHVAWQLHRDATEQRDALTIDEIALVDGSLHVSCRSQRGKLSDDGKPTFVMLRSADSDVVLAALFIACDTKHHGNAFVHRLQLRTERAVDCSRLTQICVANPALAGSLAVLQTLPACSERVRATKWLERVLLGKLRPAKAAALQAAPDERMYAVPHFVLGLSVFRSADALEQCLAEAQTLPRDGLRLLSRDRAELRIDGAPPLTIEMREPDNDDDFVPYAAQQEAVLSALTRRMTLVIGPPGTGKTDTAVRMIVALLGRFAGRLLVTAVSNLALDQLIDKLLAFAPDAVLLRLGGQALLPTARRFTTDQIVSVRTRRFTAAIHELCGALGPKSPHYAGVHELLEELPVASTPQLVQSDEDGADAANDVAEIPLQFWRSRAWTRFVAASDGALRQAVGGAHEATLGELLSIAALLSLKRAAREMALVQGSRLVFATTTGVAMRFARLREANLAFETVLMEEAAKVLETEAVACLALGVERAVLIGDHLQLPPLVADDSLRDGGVNYSQSLFTRLLRVGVPAVTLNRQGRAVTGIADLYRFRYDNLRDVAPTERRSVWPLQHAANFFDVGDGAVQNESNEREAQALVDFFDELLAKGVAPERVSVLATYRNQCNLLKRKLAAPRVQPRDVATTDAFQGLQNDVVLVSLVSVRSLSAHMRDTARMVVLLSRARSGLVLFGHHATYWADDEWRRSLEVMGSGGGGPRALEWRGVEAAAAAEESKLFRGTARSALDDDAEAMFAKLEQLTL